MCQNFLSKAKTHSTVYVYSPLFVHSYIDENLCALEWFSATTDNWSKDTAALGQQSKAPNEDAEAWRMWQRHRVPGHQPPGGGDQPGIQTGMSKSTVTAGWASHGSRF